MRQHEQDKEEEERSICSESSLGFYGSRSSLIREACSGVTWCPATPTTLRKATTGGPWHAAGGDGGDANAERQLMSVPPHSTPMSSWGLESQGRRRLEGWHNARGTNPPRWKN
jgi:hypothetical protein